MCQWRPLRADVMSLAPRAALMVVVLAASGGCSGLRSLLAHPARSAHADSTTAARSSPPRPRIVWDPIPFGSKRKAEMVAYVRRHYGSFMKPSWRLVDPHVIVIHYTDSPDFRSTYDTFAADVPDPELHELPGTCAHFVVDIHGVIHQLVRLGVMCR